MPRTSDAPNITISTLLAVCGTLLSSQALAQTLNWANTLGGAASISGNWSPAAVPNSANALVWNLNNTYITTFNSFTTSSFSHTFKRGTVSLNMSSPHSTGISNIGDVSGDVATVRAVGGTLTVGSLTLGVFSGSSGTLDITGGTTNITTGGSGTQEANIGYSGNATLNILNGGQLTVVGQFLAGGNSSSITTVNVSGKQAGGRASTLLATDTNLDSRIGAGGDVTMIVDGEATAEFHGNLIVAAGSASTSSLTVRNSTNVYSLVEITGDLSIGRNTTGAAAGNGSVTVENGGLLHVNGLVNLGNDPQGGTGVFRVSGGNASASVAGLALGANGTLQLERGLLRIRSAPFTVPAGYILNIAPTGSATVASLRLEDGATHTATNTTIIGSTALNSATISVSNGSSFVQNGGVILIGSVANAAGTLAVTDAQLTSSSLVRVGVAGTGQMSVSGTSTVSVRDLDVAASAGSTGTLNVVGGTLNVSEDLVIGGSSNGSGGFNLGGDGQLVISNGGVVNTPAGRYASITGQGLLSISNGTLNANGSVFCSGDLTLADGTINAPSVECYGTVSLRGTINARFFSDALCTLTGNLTVGNNVTNSVDRILMNIGPHTLTCIDPDVAVLADTTIAGGVINATNGLRLFGGDILSGFGTINSDFENLGTVTSNTTAGITFTGDVVSTSGQLGGTRIHFASGSTYTGRNVSGGAKWHSDAGSTLTFTAGTSSIGDNSTDAVAFAGNLDIQGSLFINDTGGFAMPPNTTIRGGGFTSIQGTTTLNRTGLTRHILRGTGTITAVFNSSGTISPGLDEADRTGTLTMGAFYSQSVAGDTGELIMDLDGTTTLLHDTLVLNGGGAVDGVLRLRVGYSPLNGQRVPLIVRGGTNTLLVGTFDQLIAPVGWSLDYRADSIDAVFCASDYNADGISDFFDYLDFVADFSSGDARADFNIDGVIDFFDYLDFVAAFSSGC